MKCHLIAALVVGLCLPVVYVDAADQASDKTSSPLLNPAPRDQSPFLPIAETAARSKFSELFQGKFTGSVEMNVDMNIAGEVLSTELRKYAAGPISEQSLSKTQRDALMEIVVHDTYFRAGALGTKFLGWYGPKRNNGLYLSYRVLKWPLDPMRSIARVNAALETKYPQYYRPRPLSSAIEEPRPALITVVMNDDGTIANSTLIENASDDDSSDRNMFDRFRALGLKPENLAYRGKTTNRGDWHDKNLSSPLLVIEYAWRRINDDPSDEVLQSLDVFERISLSHLRDQQNHPPDEAFLEKYFPDVWSDGLVQGSAAVWFLFAWEGQLIDKGTTAESSMVDVERQLQDRYKGSKLTVGMNSSAKSKAGSRIPFFYAWIAADSPIVPKPAAGVEQ